jgi:hypothetical protein
MFDDIDNLPQVPEEVETQEIEQQVQPVQEQKTSPSESFRQLRESKERIQRERDEAYNLLRQYEQNNNKRSESQSTEEVDSDLGLEADQYAEGKHLSKVDKKVRKLEEQLRQYQQQSTAQSVETRVLSQYPDFASVVNDENIEQLRSDFPELAHTLHTSTDVYSKAISTYKLIKKLGISPEHTYENEKAVVQRNAAKPRPLASISPQQSNSPLTNANAFANGLTEDLKTQLHKEMMLAIRQGR